MFDVKNISIYNSKISGQNQTVSKNRKTSSFEREVPLENGGVSYIDSTSSPICTDVFICAKPGQTRHTKFPFRCFYVHLSVSDENLYKILFSMPNFIKIKDRSKYISLFEEMSGFFSAQESESEIMVQSLILKLVYMLYTERSEYLNVGENIKSPAIKKAIDYIDKNIFSDLKLESVAKQVSLSPIHFHNCFKSATGKTLRSYVENERIKRSVNLLMGTDMTLTEIALTCGFSSQSYFSYVFKKKMNVTPREYVRKLNGKYEI